MTLYSQALAFSQIPSGIAPIEIRNFGAGAYKFQSIGSGCATHVSRTKIMPGVF